MQFLPALALGTVGAGALSTIDVVREEAKQPGNGDISRNVSLGLGAVSIGFGVVTGLSNGAGLMTAAGRGAWGGIAGAAFGIGAGAIAGALLGSQLID